MECNPLFEDVISNENNGPAQTCLPKKLVQKMAESVDMKVDAPVEKIIEKAKIVSGCTAESCAASKILGEEKIGKYYNPKGPFNSNAWLSNENIDACLEIYAKKFPEFKHVEYQMIDFAKYDNELSKLDWDETIQKYKCFGVVVNTDKTGNRGQHWFAIFVDWRQSASPTFEYFNSSGRPPPQEIVEFAAVVMGKLQKILSKTPIFESVAKVQHQTKNSECGMYALFYIISRVKKIPYSKFMYTRIDDKYVESLRPIYFRHS